MRNFLIRSCISGGLAFHMRSSRSHCWTHRLRNAVLPACGKTQSLSSPSFGKAQLPEKAGLGVESCPAAPHGTWEKCPVVATENPIEGNAENEESPDTRLRRAARNRLSLKSWAGLGCAPAVGSRGVACTCQTTHFKTSLPGFPDTGKR